MEGWPPVMPHNPIFRPYWENSNHLTVNNELLMYDDRIVIPQALQLDMLEKIHSGHLGMTRCKGRAKNSVWWPSITAHIETMVNKCKQCLLHRPERREELIPISTPENVWERVGTDLFHYEDYIVITDYTSNWIDFKELSSTTSMNVIKALCEIFATHGCPAVVVSDNGPQYASQEFKAFAKDWGFQQVTSSPRYPQSNGATERAVQTAKNILKKNTNPYLGLLAYKTAPLHNGSTQIKILMSRLLRTTLPTIQEKLQPEMVN
jgi:hypothetical protein